MGETGNELRDVPRRIARERVPTIAVVTQHGAAAEPHHRGQRGQGSRNGFSQFSVVIALLTS